MAKGTYTYEPGNITTAGLDLMRFELGDTMVEGGADTCALTDEEISAALKKYPKKWKRAKLKGPLSFSLSDRAKVWKEDYLSLKKEVSLESMAVPSPPTGNSYKDPYFYTGMLRNPRTGRLDE
jgi:hypothetical protein